MTITTRRKQTQTHKRKIHHNHTVTRAAALRRVTKDLCERLGCTRRNADLVMFSGAKGHWWPFFSASHLEHRYARDFFVTVGSLCKPSANIEAAISSIETGDRARTFFVPVGSLSKPLADVEAAIGSIETGDSARTFFFFVGSLCKPSADVEAAIDSIETGDRARTFFCG